MVSNVPRSARVASPPSPEGFARNREGIASLTSRCASLHRKIYGDVHAISAEQHAEQIAVTSGADRELAESTKVIPNKDSEKSIADPCLKFNKFRLGYVPGTVRAGMLFFILSSFFSRGSAVLREGHKIPRA